MIVGTRAYSHLFRAHSSPHQHFDSHNLIEQHQQPHPKQQSTATHIWRCQLQTVITRNELIAIPSDNIPPYDASSSELGTFTVLAKLPGEIRLRIWEYICFERRLIDIWAFRCHRSLIGSVEISFPGREPPPGLFFLTAIHLMHPEFCTPSKKHEKSDFDTLASTLV